MSEFACAEDSGGPTLVRILLPEAWDETLVAMLYEAGFGHAVAESRFESGALESDPVDARRLSEVRLVVQAEAVQVLRDCLAQWRQQWGLGEDSFRIQEEPHDPEEVDPEILWRAHWRPFRCAGFVIHADFHEVGDLSLRPGDQRLALLPGSAFGTGGHVSTRLALKVIASWCREDPPDRLLDVGTGSGILAVAAALSGVSQVEGMDPDPASPLQAAQTAALNGVGRQCHFWRGGFHSARGQWPAVVANLVADLIQGGAAALADLVAPGGLLFAGGILDLSWEQTCTVLAGQGLLLDQSLSRGRWRAGVWVKP